MGPRSTVQEFVEGDTTHVINLRHVAHVEVTKSSAGPLARVFMVGGKDGPVITLTGAEVDRFLTAFHTHD